MFIFYRSGYGTSPKGNFHHKPKCMAENTLSWNQQRDYNRCKCIYYSGFLHHKCGNIHSSLSHSRVVRGRYKKWIVLQICQHPQKYTFVGIPKLFSDTFLTWKCSEIYQRWKGSQISPNAFWGVREGRFLKGEMFISWQSIVQRYLLLSTPNRRSRRF